MPFLSSIKAHRIHFWLTNSFAFFKRKYERQVLRRFLNLAPQNAWSSICRAASLRRTVAMESLVCMGDCLDVERSTECSAVVVACETGRKISVIWLVCRGEGLSHWAPVVSGLPTMPQRTGRFSTGFFSVGTWTKASQRQHAPMSQKRKVDMSHSLGAVQ
ncbi:ankyrin repeat protein [Colletotrichum graminicola]|nr:ankyrin repeat protein [Colletotrichum graminicola]